MDAKTLALIEKVNADRFKDAVSRRSFMKVALAAGGGAAGLATLGRIPAFADTGDEVQGIIDIAVTAEALAVTYLGAVIADAYGGVVGAEDGGTSFDGVVVDILKAARAEEFAHYNLLTSAGAKPLTTTFYVPKAAMVTDKTTALETIVAAEGLFVNAYLSAVATFSAARQHTLAVYAASILGTECEHRTLARAALSLGAVPGFFPPNNLDFEQAPLPSVGAVAQELQKLGFFGPSGIKAPFNAKGIDMDDVTGTMPPNLDPGANRR